jgi:hypothetical protein
LQVLAPDRIVAHRLDVLERDQETLAAFTINLQQRRVVQHLEQLGAALHRSDLLEELLAVVRRLDARTDEGFALPGEVAHFGCADHDRKEQRHGDEREAR